MNTCEDANGISTLDDDFATCQLDNAQVRVDQTPDGVTMSVTIDSDIKLSGAITDVEDLDELNLKDDRSELIVRSPAQEGTRQASLRGGEGQNFLRREDEAALSDFTDEG